MPKTLHLKEGSITDKAIYYSYIKKDEVNRKRIENILKGTGDILNNNYWEKMKRYENLGNYKNIENYAKNYIPDEFEKELNISNLEELGDAYIHNIKEYGKTTWYDWAIENWGTKWEATGIGCDKNTIIFDTAWSTPEPIFEKLSELLPDEYIEVKYADECYSNYNNGILIFKNGLIGYNEELDETFATEVWTKELLSNEKEIENKNIIDDMYG